MKVRERPLGSLFQRRKQVGYLDETMLSVFRDHGVIRKDSRENLNKTAEDRSIYQLVESGWLVVNRMKAWQGSVGIAFERGTVSGHYLCFRPAHAEDDRFLNHLLRSEPFRLEYASLSRGVRPGQAEIDNEWLKAIRVRLPPLETQRHIADFLDDQVARLDAASASAADAARLLGERPLLRSHERLIQADGSWSLPPGWLLAPVGAFFALELGKMLNAERAGGLRLRPYLRNTNVQWDRIDVGDLKQMHFEPVDARRYGLRAGDLLICEGGQPGRAAIWDGRIAEVYYQKALHRARARRADVLPRWLLHLLRLCVHRGFFADEGGTTIAHLTGEQLRALRLPFPPIDEQRRLVSDMDEDWRVTRSAEADVARLKGLLDERKRALITACVTGEVDVSTASSRAADAALQGIG